MHLEAVHDWLYRVCGPPFSHSPPSLGYSAATFCITMALGRLADRINWDFGRVCVGVGLLGGAGLEVAEPPL